MCMSFFNGKKQLGTMVFALCLFSMFMGSCGVKSGSTKPTNEQPEQPTTTSGEEKAAATLISVLGNKLSQGKSLIHSGEDEVNGEHCWKFGVGSNAGDKFTIEEHYFVTDAGTVYLYDVVHDEYLIQAQGEEHSMPDLRIDTSKMEQLEYDTDYLLDELLYISIQSFYPFVNDEDYTKESMLARIKELQSDNIKVESITFSGEPDKDYSGGLGYATWTTIYELPGSEETEYCTDLYFRTSFGEYYIHASVPVKHKQKYKKEIEYRLSTAVLLSPLTINTVGLAKAGEFEWEYRTEEGTFSFYLQSFGHMEGNYGKDYILKRIRQQEGESDIKLISFTASEEYSQLLAFPAYVVEYTSGGNEDMHYCMNLCFQTDSGEYCVHASVPGLYLGEYKDEIKRRFATVSYDTYYTDLRYQ